MKYIKVGCPDNIINKLSELAFDRFYQYHYEKCFLYFRNINLDKPKYSKFTGAVNPKSTWGIIDKYDGRHLVENGYINQGNINIETELIAYKYNLYEKNENNFQIGKFKEGDIAKFLFRINRYFYVKIIRITPTSPYPYFVEIIEELNTLSMGTIQKYNVAKDSQIIELTPEEKEIADLYTFKTNFNL